MSAKELDFGEIAATLLNRARELLPAWFPAGVMRGNEFMVGDLGGSPGKSLKINVRTGKWSDFAGDAKGGDLLSLFAAMHGLKQGEAAERLVKDGLAVYQTKAKFTPDQRERRVSPPPPDAPAPDFLHRKMGVPSATWAYRDAGGKVLFHIARYDPPGEAKQILPYSWSPTEGGWICKAWKAPRPLYGLDLLAAQPTKSVMVVEGEKAADAARRMVGNPYVVVTWPGGAKAADMADWTPLEGRSLLLWPDADEPGIEAMEAIARRLVGKAASIKVLDVRGCQIGWDAADCVAAEWTWARFGEWAKPRAHVYGAAVAPAQVGPETTNVVDFKTGQPIAPKTVVGEASWDALNLSRPARGGSPPANLDTMMRIFEGHARLSGLLWYDEFHQRVLHKDGREWADEDDTAVAVWVQRDLGIPKMATATVREAASLYARKHVRNEPREWLAALKWDGTRRLESFLVDAYGAPANDYTSAAGRNFWISMVARVFKPGCKVDNMIVLEGAQELGKSRSLSIIGGPWYTEASESVMSKDFFQMFPGKLLIEVAELDSFTRAEVTRVKQVITCQTDRYRPSYARRAIDVPRMSVFVGTTNEDAYLRDVTGARRFWPIRCTDINTDYIASQREQLYAEAMRRYQAGETWWIMPRDQTRAEQESRRVADVWEESLLSFLGSRNEVSMSALLTDGLGLPAAKQDRQLQLRAASVLRALGFERQTVTRRGVGQKLWIRRQPVAEQAGLPGVGDAF